MPEFRLICHPLRLLRSPFLCLSLSLSFKVVFFLVTGIAIVRILLVALILLFMSLLASMASCCLPTGAPMSW